MKVVMPLCALLLCLESGVVACENGEAKAPVAASVAAMSPSAPAPDAAPQKPRLVVELETLVDGLEMPSETDAPIRVFWANESPDEPAPADYARMAGIEVKPDEPIEMRSLGELLDNVALEEEWMDADEKETARRFADLRAFLNANFAELEVLAFGESKKQIVVAGRLEGGFAGLVTLVVET